MFNSPILNIYYESINNENVIIISIDVPENDSKIFYLQILNLFLAEGWELFNIYSYLSSKNKAKKRQRYYEITIIATKEKILKINEKLLDEENYERMAFYKKILDNIKETKK